MFKANGYVQGAIQFRIFGDQAFYMDPYTPLTAISPVDGRYRQQSEPLSQWFSESAIIRYRLRVEIAYLIALSRLPLPGFKALSGDEVNTLERIWKDFTPENANQVKAIEKQINHDVKAIEYFIRQAVEGSSLATWTEFIHFGLTSQDINNTAFPMALRDAWTECLKPAIETLNKKIKSLSFKWKDIPMLARTHGQAASPTLVGKELYVFAERIENQLMILDQLPFSGKFGGATGNFNAHHVAFPGIDWPSFADNFLHNDLGLSRQQTTTQVEHYDGMAAYFDGLRRINTILLDLCRDMWLYISMDYFQQEIKPEEVGSSAMPHKVNPIDFENAEGNLGLANAVFGHLSEKLPISRLQRDLSDSTVIRNIGVPMAHTLIAINSLKKGFGKVILHSEKISADLEDHWVVLSEAIQTILRREGISDPYGKLKELTRTQGRIDKQTLVVFIESLEISREIKNELLQLSPHTYVGTHPWKKRLMQGEME